MDEVDRRNLMVNYLPNTMNSDEFNSLFARVGPVHKCKLVRNHQTGESLGYGFIEYPTENLASNAIKMLNGLEIEGKKLKVAYARPASTETKDRNVYVSSLAPHMNENKVGDLFSKFGAIETLRLLTSHDGASRGSALIRFLKSSDAARAIEMLNGKNLPESNGELVVKLALPPKQQNLHTGLNTVSSSVLNGIGATARYSNVRFNPMGVNVNQHVNSGPVSPDPLAGGGGQPATVYVYGLQPAHADLTLYELFSPFGGILNVKAVLDLTKEDKPCKGYGFVNYTKVDYAHRAVISMNNVPFENKVLKVSFKQSKTGATPVHHYNNGNWNHGGGMFPMMT